jgi:putative oxidoreductase
MAVAATMHLGRGDGLKGAAHAIELGIVFVGLLVIGAGRYSVDKS